MSPRSFRERFVFPEGFNDEGSTLVSPSRLIDVHESETGLERTLRLWRKTKTSADDDLRVLWRHETRHVQRVMSYAGARDVIVEATEFMEDDEYFGVVLVRAGQPLGELLATASPNYWMRRLDEPGPRMLLWRNVRRLASALGVLHAQGIVHGNVCPDVVMTDGFEQPDFKLTGFEWSLWLGAESGSVGQGSDGGSPTPGFVYSFESDWRSLGHLIAWTLDVNLTQAGDVADANSPDTPLLKQGERKLIRRLVLPSSTESAEATSVVRAIDDLLASLAQSSVEGSSSLLILTFAKWERVGDTVFELSDGRIPSDDHAAHVRWIQAEVDAKATLFVPRDFDADHSPMRLVTNHLVCELAALRAHGTAVPTWEIAVCRDVQLRSAKFAAGTDEEHEISQSIKVVQRFADARSFRSARSADVVDWSAFAASRPRPELDHRTLDVRRALLLAQTLEALVRTLENYPVELVEETDRGTVLVRAQDESRRDALARNVGLGASAEALYRLFEEDQRDPTVLWRLCRSPKLGASTVRDAEVHFLETTECKGRLTYEFKVDRHLPKGIYYLRTDDDVGTERVIRRRLRNLAALENQIDLGRALEDPWRESRRSPERIAFADHELAALDEPKQHALRAVFDTLPSYFVVGPPGVGKTKLATEVVRHRISSEPSARLFICAQGHDALTHLQDELKEMLVSVGLEKTLVVRSQASEGRSATDDDVAVIVRRTLEALGQSELLLSAPEHMRTRVQAQRAAAARSVRDRRQLSPEEGAANHALVGLILDAAQIFLSTANSSDVERMVADREQFDWVLVEEAAKATGPELVGPLLLSGRRLLIGDHHQLAPMEADRIARILREPAHVSAAMDLARSELELLFGDGSEFDELATHLQEPAALKKIAGQSLRLLEPFRSFVEDDESRARSGRSGRSVSSTLTEQRRMDPAIARVVSEAFYGGRLTTEPGRAARAEIDALPYDLLDGMPKSPLVVVDFPHVSATGKSMPVESHRPRWSNRQEVESVVDVLKRIRPRTSGHAPTLAVLSPYKAQVDYLGPRLRQLSGAGGPLRHLPSFASVRPNGELVGTVDSFQGSEADLVILSLVRNNARTGSKALGFLRDRRRMNVALSRAKRQLVIVGSLSFLDESVRGVNPRGTSHELSFLTTIVATLRALTKERRRDGVPLATIVSPESIRRRA